MRFRSLQLVLTDECNFACRYCYRPRGDAVLHPSVARRAVREYLPRASRDFGIYFYGGEPLLRFGLIREIVPEVRALARAAGQRPRFGLTSNGSLIDDDALAFLERHRFSLVLSYDGFAQDAQRSPASDIYLRPLVRRILEGGRIRLETNSVFTPASVGDLGRTLRGLIENGVPSVRFNLSLLTPWEDDSIRAFGREMDALGKYLARFRRRTGRLPVRSLAELLGPGLRACPAASDRLAVDPLGRIWGCAVFSDWARARGGTMATRRFSLGRPGGDPAAFDRRVSRVAAEYGRFSIDRYEGPSGPCRLCRDRERCWVCPAVAASAGGDLGRVPAFVCALQRIKARAAARLARGVGVD